MIKREFLADHLARPKKTVVVRSAYGKTYDNEIHLKACFQRGDDFRIVDGPYLSITESERYNLRVYWIGKFFNENDENFIRLF